MLKQLESAPVVAPTAREEAAVLRTLTPHTGVVRAALCEAQSVVSTPCKGVTAEGGR